MANVQSPRIHPTAVISPEAELADSVVVGPYVVIEGPVRVGAGCVLRPHSMLIGPLTMGCNNIVYPGAILGERPQHLKYKDEPTGVVIGDGNIFREHVTIHRGTASNWTTEIGSGNFFMASSHVAHDCRIGSNCILANGALIAGHCHLEDNAYLSGNSAIHQFTNVGRLALLSGCSISTKDIPPFIIQQGINCVVGVNVVGMQRAGMTLEEINAVRRAFHYLYGDDQFMTAALEKVNKELGGIAPVAEMVHFIRQSKRGICTTREHRRQAA